MTWHNIFRSNCIDGLKHMYLWYIISLNFDNDMDPNNHRQKMYHMLVSWFTYFEISKITLHKSYDLIDGRFNFEWIRNIYHSRYNAKGTGSKNTINGLDYLPCCLQAFLRCATLAIWLFAFRSAISNHNYYISMGKLWQLKYFYCPNVLKTNVLVLLIRCSILICI